jgi:Amidohydrolase
MTRAGTCSHRYRLSHQAGLRPDAPALIMAESGAVTTFAELENASTRNAFTYLGDPEKAKRAFHSKIPGAATLGDVAYIDKDGYLYGIKGLWIASGDLTGGRSPAHPDLDPLRSLMAESGTSGFLHGGGEGDFLATREWRNAPAFTGYKSMAEFDFDPWSMSIYHLPSQNYLTTLVLGGVFERHPKLHFGVAEVGSHWVGPMMASMDLLHRSFRRNEANPLTGKPSDYIRSNVRVSVLYYEPIDEWMEQFEGLEDVLCFGTDYPHVEGGNDIIERFGKRLSRLGRDVSEKFFVTNGEALFG